MFIASLFIILSRNNSNVHQLKMNKQNVLFSIGRIFSSVQFCHSVMTNSLWPHEQQHASLPVHHQLPEFTQTHVHQVSDTIQTSHPLSSPSPLALNLSQHHGLFKWVSSSHQVAKVLEFQLQHQSFQWSPLEWTGWISLTSKGLSRAFSNTQFKSFNFLVLSFLYSPALTSIHDYWKNIALTRQTFVDKIMSLLFNMVSKLVITFLPRSKRLLISWLQSPCSDFGAMWKKQLQHKTDKCIHLIPLSLVLKFSLWCQSLLKILKI